MIKCGKKDKKNYLDMQNQIGFECISSNMNVFSLLNKTYLTHGVLIGPYSSWFNEFEMKMLIFSIFDSQHIEYCVKIP